MPTHPAPILSGIALGIALLSASLLLLYRARRHPASAFLLLALAVQALYAIISLAGLSSPYWLFALSAPLFGHHLQAMLGRAVQPGFWTAYLPALGLWTAVLASGRWQEPMPAAWALGLHGSVLAYLLWQWAALRDRRKAISTVSSQRPEVKILRAQILLGTWCAFLAAAAFLQYTGSLEDIHIFSAITGAAVALGLAGVAVSTEVPLRPLSATEEALVGELASQGAPEAEQVRKHAGLFKTIDAQLQTGRLYLDGGLTLPKLAQLMGRPPREVAAAIHHVGGQTFFDYINSYRALHAQRLIDQGERNVAEVYRQSSIASYQTFVRSFQRLTGLPPAQYERQAARAHK